MKRNGTGAKRKKLIVAIICSCLAAFVVAIGTTVADTRSRLSETGSEVTERFSAIMSDYTHSFEMFEELLRHEIEVEQNADKIEAYLKGLDERLKGIEGDDYDGVYMYYQGRYLYSWDTPYSVYEQSGYDATERPWYKGAVSAAGEAWFSVPYHSYANDYMLATISRLQPDGVTVIAYDIKLGAIRSFVQGLAVKNAALTIVCDKAGNIIGSTDSSYEGGNYLATAETLAQDVAAAGKTLAEAAPEEEAEARLALNRATALQSLCNDHRVLIKRLSEVPGSLVLSRSEVGFLYD